MTDDQHHAIRELFRRERMVKRGRMTIGRRVDVALSEAKMLPGVSAPKLERESRNAESSAVGPADGRGLLFSSERSSVFDSFARRIVVLVEALEAEVDGHKWASGNGVADDQSMEARDARLLKWTAEGLSPEEIAFLDAGQGGVRAVKKALERLQKQDA